MPRRPRALPTLLALLFAGVLAAPAAQADVLDTHVSAAKAKLRTCQDGLTKGRGVVRRRFRTEDIGLVRAQLRGPRRSDWDLAIFSRLDGRLVAASAFRGSRELAEGVVVSDETLVVQACRRSGRRGRARLTVSDSAVTRSSSAPIRLVRIQTPTDASKRVLDGLGLDLTEHARDGFREALLYGAEDDAKLRKAGFAYTVKIADVGEADREAVRRARTDRSAVITEGSPSGRTEYRRLADYSSDMKELAEKHPQFVKAITLPHATLEGRPVEGIEITRDVQAKDGKPVFLQMGVHHAREWPSGEHAIEFGVDLVNGLVAKDERTMDLLSKARVIVVPVVNPDGFNLSREAGFDIPVGPVGLLLEAFGAVEEFAYKRRNCRVLDGAFPAPGQCADPANRFLGVDPNRNYGGFWGGPGASTAPDDDTYRGAGPFSEPETQNVKALVSSRQVTTLITNHTYSDLVLRPPGIKQEGDPPDEPVYKALGDAMAAENGYKSEKSWELYDTTGTTEDWSYYATGGLGFTFEIGRAADGPTGFESLVGAGFHPPYPVGVLAEYHGKHPGGGGNREAYFTALESTANPERHSVITGEAPAGATLRLHKEFDSYTSPVTQADGGVTPPQAFRDVLDTTMVAGGGRFEWHVNPSTRPFKKKTRVLGIPADEAGSSTPFEQATVAPPVSTHPITVAEDGLKGAIGAYMDGADGDDWDMYLYEGTSIDPTKQVASSASAGADERIMYLSPKPGEYLLEIRYFTATSGYTGAIELYGEKDTIELPAGEETWTMTCERNGKVVGSTQVSVERGGTADVGALCAKGPGKNKGNRRDGTAPFGVKVKVRKGSLRRKGLRIAVTCEKDCTAKAVARLRGKRGKGVRVRSGARRLRAGTKTVLRKKLTRKQVRRLRGKRVRAVVRVRATSGTERVVARRRARLRR